MAERGFLIISADDVGRDVEATDRTLECFEAGRVTSASAMVYMEDSDRASAALRASGVPVGLHINLSEAFTDPATPPDVLSRQARLLPRFGPDEARRTMRWVYDPRIRADVERCIEDQLQRFQALYGGAPTHVDGHQHVHLCPNVFFARSLSPRIWMRATLDTYPLQRSPHAVARTLRERLIRFRFATTDYFFDVAEVDPRLRTEEERARLALSESASVEVMAHAAFDHERECLMSPEWEEALRSHPLGSFADLHASGRPDGSRRSRAIRPSPRRPASRRDNGAPTSMRVLAITNEFPLPLDRGGPVRCFGLARALAEQHEVHFLALRRPNTTENLEAELKSTLGGRVEVFDPGVVRSFPGRWSRAVLRGVPPWIREQHSPDLERRARELAPGMDVVVVLDDYAAIYAAELSRAAPVVCDKHNVLGFSATLAPREHGARGRVRRRLGIPLSRRFERAALRHADAVVATSDEESERLAELYGRPASAVVPSAVDVPATPREPAGAPVVGWLGTHEYAANVEGLMRFVEDGWEPLGAGGFQLLVAGGGAPPEVLELDARAGVDILGFVDDLDGLFARLGVAVVPIWRGAGVKLKTLTFMAAGVPVVGTPAAVEGIDGQDGNHFLVAEDPAGLAEGIRRVVSDAELARRLGAGGRELVRERYSWPAVGARFRADVERAVAAADGNPRG